jgi:DNA segregation ATPase FtsK/SpoIIIE-like protein
VGHNEEKTRLIDLQDLQQTNTKHTIKSLLKDKISQAIQKKEDDHTIKQLHITFPQDKPSYNIELLDENPYKDSQIDEERLLEKAEAVKNKLQEFGIEVEIDGCNI